MHKLLFVLLAPDESALKCSEPKHLILPNFRETEFARRKGRTYCQLHNWTKRQITKVYLECLFDEDIFCIRVARFVTVLRLHNRKRPCLHMQRCACLRRIKVAIIALKKKNFAFLSCILFPPLSSAKKKNSTKISAIWSNKQKILMWLVMSYVIQVNLSLSRQLMQSTCLQPPCCQYNECWNLLSIQLHSCYLVDLLSSMSCLAFLTNDLCLCTFENWFDKKKKNYINRQWWIGDSLTWRILNWNSDKMLVFKSDHFVNIKLFFSFPLLSSFYPRSVFYKMSWLIGLWSRKKIRH